MLARTGNLSNVYAEFWRMQEIAECAEPQINRVVAASKSLEAEITPDSHADWYLVQTFPGDDVRAMRWLSRRKFGTFRPMQQRSDKRNGAPVQGWEPVFPGWIFVFVWDIKKLKARLKKCPGVFDILCDPVTQQPAPVDQKDRNGVGFIDRLRGLAWVYKDNAPRRSAAGRIAATQKLASTHKLRRPTKHERKTLDRLKKDFKDQGLEWDETKWADANRLEPHLRIALLSRTLKNAPSLQVAPRASL